MDSVAGIFLKAIILFFVQPLFWLGLFVALISSMLRIKKERKIYRVAIYKKFSELQNFLISGLLSGIIASAIVMILGITISIEWLWIYPIVVSLCFLLLGYRYIHPMFTIPITVGVLFLISYLMKDNSAWSFGQLSFGMNFINTNLIQNSLIISLLMIIATYFLFKQATRFLSPNFRKTSRGKLIASYLIKPLSFLPLFILLPGEQFTTVFNWWPVFSIGNDSYTLLAIPILIGLRIKIETQPLKQAIKAIQKDLILLSIVLLTGIVLSYYVDYLAEATLVFAFLGGVTILMRHHLREKKWHFLYGPVGDGIKIVGIRPDTPATKMRLEIGETIVVCNNQAVKNDEEFYQALLINSAYCHLKIRGLDGEYRLTETAIFADSPHELGIVTIPDKIK